MLFRSKGYYDLNTKKSKFTGRTSIQDSTSFMTANEFVFDEQTGQGEAKGEVDFIDTAQHIMVRSDKIFFNKKRKNVMAVGKPVMTLADKADSVFVAADTIYSAKYAELPLMPSTDSSKFITAYRNVRIYNDSLQAICDSLFYGEKDSIFKLYQQPVAWSRNSQMSGDTMIIETADRQPKAMHVIDNAIMVQETDKHFRFYDQIKGNTIDGQFNNGVIERVETRGNSESIYYIKDENEAYVGMNKSEANEILIFFYDSAIKKIKFNSEVKGTTFPINKIPEEDKFLKNFKWLDSKRPKNKQALFLK